MCEPYFTRPLSEISLAEVLLKLFRTAQRYELTLQPQLILLQKTLLNIEGVGRLLDPKLDIWAVARPVLSRILIERYSPQRLASEFRKRLPELVTHAPEMPRLLHAWLTQQVEGRHELHAALAVTWRSSTARSVQRSGAPSRRSWASACWCARPCCTGSKRAARACCRSRRQRGSPASAVRGR